MTAAITAAVVGTVGGAYLSGEAQKDASKRAAGAAAFNPIGLNTLGGAETRFANGSYGTNNSPYAGVFDQYRTGAEAGLAQNAGTATDARNMGATGVMGAYGNLQGMPDLPPEVLAQYQGANQNLTSQANPAGLFGMSQNLLGGNSTYDQAGNFMMNQGANALNTNFAGIAGDRLSTLRAAAAPYESLATNKFKQGLFNRGTLNDNTGSGLLAREFGKGLAMADQSRVINSQDFAQNQLNMDRQYGTGMFGAGLNAINQGQMAGQSLYGMGLAGTQFGAAQAQQLFQNQMGTNQFNYTRGQTRLADAGNLFNFGTGIQDTNLNQTNNQINTMLGLSADERSNFATAGNISGQQATAGANVANAYLQNNTSPFGTMLSSAGTATLGTMFQNGWPTSGGGTSVPTIDMSTLPQRMQEPNYGF